MNNNQLPVFAFLGWEVVPRAAPPVLGRNSKDYSACILVFADAPEVRVFAEHHVELFEHIVRELYRRSPKTIVDFADRHRREVLRQSNRVIAFGANAKELADGVKYKISLPGAAYYFLDSQAQPLARALFEHIHCLHQDLKACRSVKPEDLSAEAHDYIQSHSI